MRFDGDKLKTLREARKWDQMRLANEARRFRAGVHQSAISKHEHGHQQPTSRNASAYAKALGVSVLDLYSLDDDEEEAAMASAPLTREEQAFLAGLMSKLGMSVEVAK